MNRVFEYWPGRCNVGQECKAVGDLKGMVVGKQRNRQSKHRRVNGSTRDL